jgi:hypothetical protein
MLSAKHIFLGAFVLSAHTQDTYHFALKSPEFQLVEFLRHIYHNVYFYGTNTDYD